MTTTYTDDARAWYLAHPDDSHYTHPDGRRWPRVSTVVAEWQRCAMNQRIPKEVLREAANLGTCVHAGIASVFGRPYNLAALPHISERSAHRAGHAAACFLQWSNEHAPRAQAVELRLSCDEDEVVGTADWIGHIEHPDAKGAGLIDWKTGALYLGGKIALAKYLDMANRGGLGLRWAALVRLEKDAEYTPPYYEMKLYTVDDLAPALKAWSHLRALNRLNLTEC